MRERRPGGGGYNIGLYVLLSLIAAGVIILLIIGGITLSNTYNIQNIVNNEQCCDCFDEGRSQAYAIANGITLALNLLSINPYASTDLFISFFDENATWSTMDGNSFGIDEIRAFYLSYALNPGETNQTITLHNIYWDAKTSTLSMERNWTAVLTQPRLFTNYTTFVPNVTLGINDSYVQDDFVIGKVNCVNGRYLLVYYREYFDSVQSQTFFTTDYPPTCEPCTDEG